MLILRGTPALSDFRLQKLTSDFKAAGLPVATVYAEFLHVVDLSADLSADEKATLEKVLHYGPMREVRALDGELFVVCPRPGTISPWSSKATDIAHICGLPAIKRIERAIAYYVKFDGAAPADAREKISAKIHDRMTQAVFADTESLAVLFNKEEPRPLNVVPVLTEGREALVKADKEMGLALSPDEIDYLAFAQTPAPGLQGYLYNPATKTFLTSTGAMSATEGYLFELNKSSDVKSTGVENGWKCTDGNGRSYTYVDPTEEGVTYYFARFTGPGNASPYLRWVSSGAWMNGVSGMNKWAIKEVTGGWNIRNIYDDQHLGAKDADENYIDYLGWYLVATEDGSLGFEKTATEAALWKYVDKDEYAKIVGPTYPIDLSGDAAKVAVVVNGEEATFTPTGTVQNQFQIKNMDISEFRAYGYKKIVVEFSGAAAGQFHAHAYENGNDPHWDIVTGVTGFNNDYEAPEWLSVGENKFEVELRADKDAIEDFTIFTWFDESAGPLTVKAYFSKDELATSISSVKVAKAAKGIYNVAGQQMKNLQKGLNIVDGKKIFVK